MSAKWNLYKDSPQLGFPNRETFYQKGRSQLFCLDDLVWAEVINALMRSEAFYA